jgi:hypothetical protein
VYRLENAANVLSKTINPSKQAHSFAFDAQIAPPILLALGETPALLADAWATSYATGEVPA